MIDLLACTVMPYAWGSRHAIAELTGRDPSPHPEAELWMGAHPVAPSCIEKNGRTLTQLIADDPEHALGPEVEKAFGPRLPFLMKVLAAAEPLSLQAHPTMAQAIAGFGAEDARNIPRDAPHRNYRDASHKPELLCALTPFEALCGFRTIDESIALFDALAVPELVAVLGPLRERHDLAATFRAIMTLSKEEGARAVAATANACRAGMTGSHRWAAKLAELYPGDVGVISSLLLNQVRLEPGQAIYLDAGNLHAYLDGLGVEIMASSDNVLRGGLTKKHVDVPELMSVLDFTDGPIVPLAAEKVDAVERVWVTVAREFRLSVLEVDAGHQAARDVRGPEILLCTAGKALLKPRTGAPVTLERGGAAFVPAATGHYELSASDPEARATLYRATVNLTEILGPPNRSVL